MLQSFVEIKFEICSTYKAQCAEENSPLKFTELFQEMRNTSAARGLEIALKNNSVNAYCVVITAQLIVNTLET